MTIVVDSDQEVLETLTDSDEQRPYLQWSAVIVGALCAVAFSFILVTFAVSIGLAVSSTSPTWRDTSIALAILSGIYLILETIASFGVGGYIAGRICRPNGAMDTDEVLNRDGLHGLAAWAFAVVLGAVLAASVAAAGLNRASSSAATPNATVAEPLLSYELDKMFRTANRPAKADMTAERAEAGRILMTSSSHSGVSGDDRTYLIQQVAATTTGLSAAEAERRVDTAIGDSRTAISRSRRSTIIMAFSLAAAALLGAVAAWAAACAGGRHRDGAPIPEWMAHANRFERQRVAT